MNRCCACNKFCKWEDLTVESFIPDSYFGGEDTVYICLKCEEKEKKERETRRSVN